MERIRVWKELNVEDIDKHLLIIDDLHGHCNSCKKTGIKIDSIDSCPECGTEFTYISTKMKPSSPNGKAIFNKLFKNHPLKLIIDYDDYKHLSDKAKASNLFKDM